MLLITALVLACFSACSSGYDWDEPTALDDYVNFDDGEFKWEVINEIRYQSDLVTVYILNITSQRWMDESFSNAHIWWHYQAIAVPDLIRRNFAYQFIDGGNNNPPSSPPDENSIYVDIVKQAASLTGYVVATLLQVPNQGVIFADDPDQKSRTEDDFISYTWKTFITTHQDKPEVLARMPMTKAAKRGHDAIREFVLSIRPNNNIQQFGAGGGSKRGWTAWSVAATDRRVVLVTPMVMSLMNFNDTLQSHYRTLGGWTWTFYDYWEKGLTAHFHDDIVTNWDYGLFTYEDMFRYKERLDRIPKLMISAAGDQFFLPTDSHTWWNEMNGPKWIMMNPNAGHGLDNSYDNVVNTLIAWLMLTLEPLLPNVPQLVWLRGSTSTNGRISLNASPVPSSVTAWVARSLNTEPKRKDFRMHAVGPVEQDIEWFPEPVTTLVPGMYEVEFDNDPDVYTGFFVEAVWTNLVPLLPMRLSLTTEVHVTPDNYPFAGCYGAECAGEMV